MASQSRGWWDDASDLVLHEFDTARRAAEEQGARAPFLRVAGGRRGQVTKMRSVRLLKSRQDEN